MRKLIILSIIILMSKFSMSQTPKYQYFDEFQFPFYDTIWYKIDTISKVSWNVVQPKKNNFNSALSYPNALITGIDSSYGTNLNHSIVFGAHFDYTNWIRSLAFTWSQKIDFEYKMDYGIFEFSLDSGKSWINPLDTQSFGNYYFNFYGFNYDSINLYSDKSAFTGTDLEWRDVWFCIYNNGPPELITDSFLYRFTIVSDSVQTENEGWMIDNFLFRESIVHTVSSNLKVKDRIVVYPNISNGIVHVESTFAFEDKVLIESISVINSEGREVLKNNQKAKRATLNLSAFPDGTYYINAKYSKGVENLKIIVRH